MRSPCDNTFGFVVVHTSLFASGLSSQRAAGAAMSPQLRVRRLLCNFDTVPRQALGPNLG